MTTVGYIQIHGSTIFNNKNITFTKVEQEYMTTCYKIIHVELASVIVSLNKHQYSDNLIFITMDIYVLVLFPSIIMITMTI